MAGNVVGVNTALLSTNRGSVGIGFDIPAATAEPVLEQLKEKGYVKRAWLGGHGQFVAAEASDGIGTTKAAQGALVKYSQPGSPAAGAGIRTGDVIAKLNGRPVRDSRELAQKIGSLAPGTFVELNILRKGVTKTVPLRLGAQPRTRPTNPETNEHESLTTPRLGLSLAPNGEVTGAQGNGVLVTDVDPSGAAAAEGFERGDVILDMGGKPVVTADEVGRYLQRARSEGKHHVLTRVKAAKTTKFLALPALEG